jgi:hypothetical protein
MAGLLQILSGYLDFQSELSKTKKHNLNKTVTGIFYYGNSIWDIMNSGHSITST